MAISKRSGTASSVEALKKSSLRMLHDSLVIYRIKPWRSYIVILLDSVMALASFLLAFLIRFEFSVPVHYLNLIFDALPFVVGIRIVAFIVFRLHTGLWCYVGISDCRTIIKAVSLGSLAYGLGSQFLPVPAIPRSVLLLDWILCVSSICGIRLVGRIVRENLSYIGDATFTEPDRRRVIVVGAGNAGEMLVREILRGSMNNGIIYDVVGIMDDDSSKWGIKIHGCRVLSGIEDLPGMCQSYSANEILIALPAASKKERQRILHYCRETGLPFKTVPSLADICQRKVKINQIQEVEPEDILEREPVSLDLTRLRKEIQGKRIMVTGAAGSIGSELCRQVAVFNPENIILYDRAESNLYLLELQLKREYPAIEFNPIVGDILSESSLDHVMSKYSPDYLFHAAAYKHVPLMEAFPLEAIQNNVIGSEMVGRAAIKSGVKKVVFISTDKAVKPVGVMGMTKRISECLLQTLENDTTTFIAVRFGNVLGSDGSVLPIFKGQIDRGESLTVTDPDATRYFMLISEAAKLVIQSGVMGKGGEIFFLDMGEPVRIMDMAEKLVRLSGYIPHKDVHISLSGLRPGERLREDLVMEQESLSLTEHEKIFAVRSQPLNNEAFAVDMKCLKDSVERHDLENAMSALKSMVARY